MTFIISYRHNRNHTCVCICIWKSSNALTRLEWWHNWFSIVPSGKPTITAAHNTSSTSIQLIWRPPPKQSINGEFLGYEISHRPRNDNATGSILTVQQKIKDPEVTQYTIQDLQPFTQYLVSLRVINPAGLGPETKVVVMTDEGGKRA